MDKVRFREAVVHENSHFHGRSSILDGFVHRNTPFHGQDKVSEVSSVKVSIFVDGHENMQDYPKNHLVCGQVGGFACLILKKPCFQG